ncbi:hypothetical protein SAMN02800692_1533 [Luteibacter sp. UNC138MFCol5.1]|nr:hypothetical protein SAMN02800692_1533 [Luteibacter sp. UNC138MFCol5.1]
MRAAELMARLNPTNIRYDVGRGGLPELTAQDIAAAIGMVSPGLGRELMCRLWWPEGAQLAAKELDRLLMEAQLGEWRRRSDALITAQLRAEVAESDRQRRVASTAVDAAKAEQWPRVGPGSPYAKIRIAVLAEMSAACLCPDCRGRGFVMIEGKIRGCATCETSGRAKVSDRARAEMVGVNRETYRTSIAPVYTWLIDFCQASLEPARREFMRRIE